MQSDRSGPSRTVSRPLYVYNAGFLTQTRVRRILSLAGYRVTVGLPDSGDVVGVWGQSPTSHRGSTIAQRRGAELLRVEDAWLRSLRPARAGGDPPIGLLLDRSGVHFDPSTPSDLETLLSTAPLDDPKLLDRARGALVRLQDTELTKYSGFDPDQEAPPPGYVLVVDQTLGDASVTASGADRSAFLEMLAAARRIYPDTRIVIKTHPETQHG